MHEAGMQAIFVDKKVGSDVEAIERGDGGQQVEGHNPELAFEVEVGVVGDAVAERVEVYEHTVNEREGERPAEQDQTTMLIGLKPGQVGAYRVNPVHKDANKHELEEYAGDERDGVIMKEVVAEQ